MQTMSLQGNRQIRIGLFTANDIDCELVKIEEMILGVCMSGRMVIELDNRRFDISADTVIFILDTSINILEKSDDFTMKYAVFSQRLFWEAGTHINPIFFGRMRTNPVVTVSSIDLLEHYFFILQYCSDDDANKYRMTIARNTLQSIMLDIYDNACRGQQVLPKGNSRQDILFRQFVQLIVKHCYIERDVCFYADHLCITPRYLSAVSRNLTGMSAKSFIDKHAIIEIKSVLKSTTLDIQEVAFRFGFPNKSFFGRYFKKHTGMSPLSYRQN